VPSQQPQGQLQTEHSVDKSNYIIDKHIISQRQITGKCLGRHNNEEK
jgi:hypothetical protein